MKKIFRYYTIIFIILLLILHTKSNSYSTENTSSFGIWITVFSPEKILYSKENIDKLINICKTSNIKNIYLQIYRADKAYYNSNITDNTPYKQIIKEAKIDTIKYITNQCKKNNIKIHAWLNILSISQNTNANIIKKYGEKILTIDQYGRTPFPNKNKDKLDNYYIRENQLFIEPGDNDVKQYITNIIKEIITKYPNFSGVHLDYIRYPVVVPFVPGSRFTSHGISYGYSKTNIENFEKTTKIKIKELSESRNNFQLWDNWRRQQITNIVNTISKQIKEITPHMTISCTIVPSIQRTYLATFQNWTKWLEKKYIDYIIVMNYTTDTKLMELNTKSLLLPEFKNKIHIGLGAYLLKNNIQELKKQINILKKITPLEIVLFSYDEIANNKDLQEFLSKN